ncbi:hypothetical protein KAR50_00110 [Periweissella fabaria]|uniref:Uncharacterized protein n=1 Tax=Periweissella fabaria TaxID=546157 RepID=A0ABM8Z8D6_9LACO|nr:hypothetical protein [Periweissella fabaria]MCM0596265.1 hypothetical protein [Periweissella fabaria]CAH0417483.1 hypothetical protein WFA24289_01825 [Periweissella fabaria]
MDEEAYKVRFLNEFLDDVEEDDEFIDSVMSFFILNKELQMEVIKKLLSGDRVKRELRDLLNLINSDEEFSRKAETTVDVNKVTLLIKGGM